MDREEDIRQSNGWGKYLESIGWETVLTSGGILIAIRSTVLGRFVKIQHPKKIDTNDLSEIEQICRDRKCAYIKIEPDFDQEISIFQSAGYKPTYAPNCVPSTIFINLKKSEEELKSAFTHSALYSLNRAIREGFTGECITHPTESRLRENYAIFLSTAREKNFYLPPFKEFSVRNELFGDKSYLCEVRDANGVLQTSKFCLGHRNMVLYVSGGTTAEARKNKSGYLLMWEAIKFFKDKGYDVFDLEGKSDARFPLYTKNWEGFSYFKEKFGGTPIEFPVPQIKFLNKFFETASKITGMYL